MRSRLSGDAFLCDSPAGSQRALAKIFLDETQECFHQGFARVCVPVDEQRADEAMRAPDRYCRGPVVGIDVTNDRTTWNDLVIEKNLAVVSGIDLCKLPVGPLQETGDVLLFG